MVVVVVVVCGWVGGFVSWNSDANVLSFHGHL